MTSFDLVILCDLVAVFAVTKSVTKSRLHCTRITFFKSAISYTLTQTTGEIRMRYILRFVLALSFLMKSYHSVATPKKALSFLMKSYHSVKGQLISKHLLERIVSTKIATKNFDNFCPGGQIKKIKTLYYIKYPIIDI